MIKEIIIDVETSNDIQLKNVTVDVMKAVVKEIIETHALDEANPVINSPLFISYQKKLYEAEIAFLHAKEAMIRNVLKNDYDKIKSWSLDYYTCKLTYDIKE